MSVPEIIPVELPKAYRLLNHGPTVLVSAQHGEDKDVTAAAWACALEITPAKVTVVLDKSTKTRQLVEQSGYFALQVACFDQIDMVHQLAMVYPSLFYFRNFRPYLAAIRIAPSRRITSPFRYEFSAMCATKRANSSGRPKRDG